jgi:hypothetical protein
MDERYFNHIKRSELLPLSKKTPGSICLEHLLNTGPGDALVQVMGIEFYKLVNGKEVLVKGDAMRILKTIRHKNCEATRQRERTNPANTNCE